MSCPNCMNNGGLCVEHEAELFAKDDKMTELKTEGFWWQDKNKYLFSVKDITGALAMWAVRQSPFNQPANLEKALAEAHDFLKDYFGKEIYLKLDAKEIESLCMSMFEKNSHIESWNKPLKGPERTFYASSRFEQLKPEYDIIDLHALARNVSRILLYERQKEC